MYVNGNRLPDDTKMDIIGRCARVILEKNEIVKLEIFGDDISYMPTDAGMITKISSNEIQYRQYGDRCMQLPAIDEYKKIVTVIDGRECSYSALKENMVFEYAIVDNVLFLFATGASYAGNINSVSDSNVQLDSNNIAISSKPTYISTDGSNIYKADISVI